MSCKANRTKKGVDKQFAEFDEKLDIRDFMRTYQPKKINVEPVTERQIEEAFHILGKHTPTEKSYDCHACGYKSCRDMAIALARGINEKENCHQYMMNYIRKERQKVAEVNQKVLEMNNDLLKIFGELTDSIAQVKTEAGAIREAGQASSAKMEDIMTHMNEMNRLNQSISDSLSDINQSVGQYNAMTQDVEKIAGKINLLSLNATIEAARAGEAGRGFAVVASNIQELSKNSKESVSDAQENDEAIHQAITEVNEIIHNFSEATAEMLSIVNMTIDNVEKTSDKSHLIEDSMGTVSQMADRVKSVIEKTNDILS